MKIKLALQNNSFISFIEKAILNDINTGNLTLLQFDEALWFFLCSLNEEEKNILFKQLKKVKDCTSTQNIGNIRLMIFKSLKIKSISK